MVKIAILMPLCSKNQEWKSISDIDFINTLDYIYQTKSFKNELIFYLGYDENDEFFVKNHDSLNKRLKSTDKLIVLPKSCNGSPYNAWNILLTEAIKDNQIEYFYQLGSDIVHLTKDWDTYFINILQKSNNIGITGGVDKRFWIERINRNQNGILENIFFHKKHFEIFGYFIRNEGMDWFGDDMLSEAYRKLDKCFICPTVLFSNTNRVGGNKPTNRYKPNMTGEKIWRNLANQEYLKIKDYFNKN
tara:strand:+ start:149 stop:886 length:738 start_codon:yes stop_codon:yes gene_type:complete